MDRTNTKRVKIGNVVIGGQNKVYIQSMCNIKTSKVKSVVKQILELEELGCDIIRVSVLDEKDAKAIKKI
ncbi:MAG: flavodoxin-dependent (E)-4-hydroxy-3-methylbut-2-enyl-diphosphate synthase, partial [Bacilli bacterium]|nr:flavodoxin-dependent (E)-4-hydroxy-3-methylbut-2-enyl-diphosphate synthase [Bacilli bacterium]